jgi:predicted nucleotidyltransferase component of viral defense system
MKYANAARFRRALEDRLLAQSRRGPVPLARLRKRTVFERLLARLVAVDSERWLVKGASALELRFGNQVRGTRDLDLSHPDDSHVILRSILEAQEVGMDDYFSYAIQPTSKLEPLGGVAVRYHVREDLAGRRFEEFHIDIGVRSIPVITPDRLSAPDFLTFADIEPVVVPVIAIEQHIAEKVIAYVRIYEGQRRSSRVKDLVDLVLIQSLTTVAAGRLRHALAITFQSRDDTVLPNHFPPPPVYWQLPYRQMASEVGIDPTLEHGHRIVAAFLDPILGDVVEAGAVWVPQQRAWLSPS